MRYHTETGIAVSTFGAAVHHSGLPRVVYCSPVSFCLLVLKKDHIENFYFEFYQVVVAYCCGICRLTFLLLPAAVPQNTNLGLQYWSLYFIVSHQILQVLYACFRGAYFSIRATFFLFSVRLGSLCSAQCTHPLLSIQRALVLLIKILQLHLLMHPH